MTGLEMRGCWEVRPVASETATEPAWVPLEAGPPTHRGFVPVDEIALMGAAAPRVPAPVITYVEVLDAPTSLFGDAER